MEHIVNAPGEDLQEDGKAGRNDDRGKEPSRLLVFL